MKMKGQLDSIQPLKKHKIKSKKNELKKKKKDKLDNKKLAKAQKESKAEQPKKTQSKSSHSVPDTSEATNNTPKTLDSMSEHENADSSNQPTRQRASKSLEPMTKEEQLIAINQIIKRLLLDEVTQGTALKELRVSVLGLRQDAYTQLTGVSRKTLSEIENDKGNYTAEVINKVFKPFDLKVGLVPTSSQLLAAILTH